MTENRVFDFFKHLTTLNFAAIGFLILAIEHDLVKVVPKEQVFPLIFASFASSLVCSFVLMFLTMAPWKEEPKGGFAGFLMIVGLVSLGGFLVGMFLLSVATGVIVFQARA